MVWTKYNSATRVHRLVLMAFDTEGYFDGAVVNHKNGVKWDNRLENLEWCTISQNTKHAYDKGLAKSPNSQCVAVYHKGEIISIFESFNELSRHCNVDRNTLQISSSKNKAVFDELFLLKYEKEIPIHLENKPFCNNPMSKYQLQPVSYKDIYYESINELSEELNVSHSRISKAIYNKKYINGFEVKKITRYEFIKQNNFND